MANIKLEHVANVLVITMKNGDQHVKTEQDLVDFRGVIKHSHLLYDVCSVRIDQSQIADWALFHDVWVATASNLEIFVRAIGTTDKEALDNLNKRFTTYAKSSQS